MRGARSAARLLAAALGASAAMGQGVVAPIAAPEPPRAPRAAGEESPTREQTPAGRIAELEAALARAEQTIRSLRGRGLNQTLEAGALERETTAAVRDADDAEARAARLERDLRAAETRLRRAESRADRLERDLRREQSEVRRLRSQVRRLR